MDRTPPVTVRRALRAEVGFGCPVAGCANPYLEYHHFDPPWREREHHDPAGMIALCTEHHRKADGGSFTAEQLKAFKNQPNTGPVLGRFDYLRRNLLAVVGGNFFYETPEILRFRGQPAIWFRRDEDGHLLLNLRMITSSGERRLRLEDNDWIVQGNPTDFESPPSGKRIYGRYDNGDELKIEFFELAGLDDVRKKYPRAGGPGWDHVTFPITAVEVLERIGGTDLGFGPDWIRLPGTHMSGGFSAHCGTAIVYG